MAAYYNENDPFAAAWLNGLIKQGRIAPGEVDERSVWDVQPGDLRGFDQHHFFAGIGVWSYALRQAGWPDDLPVWTGSCPCQPFSAAGKGKGFADERHLWPAWEWLIRQCRPSVIFGEQVGGKAGESWFDLVSNDLETADYACGAVTFPACSVGAPHLRQRLYWVAGANSKRQQRVNPLLWEEPNHLSETPRCGETSRVGKPDSGHSGRHTRTSVGTEERAPVRAKRDLPGTPSAVDGFWADADWVYCRDDKFRPIEPGTFPLVNGSPNRLGRLRGYGNSLNAPQAQAFIESAMPWLHATP